VCTVFLRRAQKNRTPAKESTALPKAKIADRVSRDDERYERYSSAEIIANYRTKAATMWPGLRDFLIYALHDQHDMVIEGYHLEPAFVHELRTSYPQFSISAVFLCRTQPEQLTPDLQQSTDPTDCVLRAADNKRGFR
jgi:hypothetical protein